jgi:putative tryptophan/tyrosine transport system substrate-binding protein
MIGRREFITLLGGAAAWPLATNAQSGRMRHIGVLVAAAADDSVFQAHIAAFLQGLAQLGWSEGRNVRIDIRWATANADELRRHAAELAALAPDVILAATGTATTAPLLQATRTVPIVFAIVIDPVGAGFVASLAGPGGNATGFLMFEYGLAGKWLELLKQIAPRVTRVAVLRDPTIASGIGQFAAVQAVAPSLGVELSPVDVRDAPEIERAVTAFARSSNGGLIVTPSALANRHRELIATLAVQPIRLVGRNVAGSACGRPTLWGKVNMRRREFITLLVGIAVAWPLAVRAQQPERVRRHPAKQAVSE